MRDNIPYSIPSLPIDFNLETVTVLKEVVSAGEALARLDEASNKIPNEDILINTLMLQESRFSSEVENIMTTDEEVYEDSFYSSNNAKESVKEVRSYRDALYEGWMLLRGVQSSSSGSSDGILTNRTIKKIHAILINNDAGFRTQGETLIANSNTREVVYEPPSPIYIEEHMANLERFINDNEVCSWHPMIKLAIIHHQFESIHPFYDGNGRVGRIINILYLVQQKKLRLPILYLSRYINSTKDEYYSLLKGIQMHEEGSQKHLYAWEKWILYVLKGIRTISDQTTSLINDISILMEKCERDIAANEKSKNYAMPLTQAIFMHTYTDAAQTKGIIRRTRQVATRQLDNLCDMGILSRQRVVADKRKIVYVNIKLLLLLYDVGKYYDKSE